MGGEFVYETYIQTMPTTDSGKIGGCGLKSCFSLRPKEFPKWQRQKKAMGFGKLAKDWIALLKMPEIPRLHKTPGLPEMPELSTLTWSEVRDARQKSKWVAWSVRGHVCSGLI